MSASIHRPISDSRILLIVGVNDIGRRSCSIVFGGLVFGIGITFACFHIVGITLSRTDELNMWHSGSDRAKAKSRRNQFGRLSGPGALWMFIRSSLWKTSNSLI